MRAANLSLEHRLTRIEYRATRQGERHTHQVSWTCCVQLYAGNDAVRSVRLNYIAGSYRAVHTTSLVAIEREYFGDFRPLYKSKASCLATDRAAQVFIRHGMDRAKEVTAAGWAESALAPCRRRAGLIIRTALRKT